MLGIDGARRRAALHDLGNLGDGLERLAFDGFDGQAGHMRCRHHVRAGGEMGRGHLILRAADVQGGASDPLLVECDSTDTMFSNPTDERTENYVTGRFG